MDQPKVILVVMDGWGYRLQKEGNAIAQAKKPNFDLLWQNYPHALLEAAGEPVGLPWGSIGSSEVGHACLGAGRIIHQDFPRISKIIATGEFYKNPVLLQALNYAQKQKSSLHLVGLVSAGGVHSHIEHLFALLELLRRRHFRQPSFIQMFTDGRDVSVQSAASYIEKINAKIHQYRLKTRIASVVGRYYAMDRDSRWQRTFAAYDCLVLGKGEKATSAQEVARKAYFRGLTDEFIPPTVVSQEDVPAGIFQKIFEEENPKIIGQIQNNDAVIFFNFRPERIRQLVETFLFPQQNYPGKKLLKNVYYASLVSYEKSLPIKVAIQPEKIENPLTQVLSKAGVRQLHIAETEKYAQATYFFDGGSPVPFKNEDWITVSSPKVSTYDLQPEMSAQKITNTIFEVSEKKKYDFILINFANADMVGHSGNLVATIKAIEAIDQELGRLVKRFPQTTFLITADHGNAESMISTEGKVDTEHSVAPVPFLLVGRQFKKNTPSSNENQSVGILADVAPTVLDLLNIPPPPEMTGLSLVKVIN